jgi:hypothetical protein
MRIRNRDTIKVVRPITYIHTSKSFLGLHLSWIHLIVYTTLFIEKEFKRYKSFLVTFILLIINLIYHLVTLVS